MTPAPVHFPFLGGDPRRMGVAAIDEADWFELGADYAAQMAEKERLLRECHDAVFAALPAAETPSREVLEMASRWLASRTGFALEEETVACPDGRAVHLEAAHPLETASLLVQEDLCLMRAGESGAPVLIGASLCFPSRWVLAEKLGRPMQSIHGPVPALNGRIGGTIDRFLAGLKEGQIYSRANWSLTTDPALFQPVALPHAPIAAAEAGTRVFYRVERQTLRRLPKSGAVLFGIRIHQHPLSALKAVPGKGRQFAEALAALDPALVAYKSMAAIRDPVLAYLSS